MPSVATDAVRFGLSLGSLQLLTPPDRPAQFIASAAIYPLPLAPRRLRGLTQLRGHPVSVVDARPDAPAHLPTLQRQAVLIVGDPAHWSLGFLVEGPPAPLTPVADPEVAAGEPPPVSFASALASPLYCRAAPDDKPGWWWQADFSVLFEALMADR